MSLDAGSLARFYRTPLGRRVETVLARKLRRLLGPVAGKRIAFVGFGEPVARRGCLRRASVVHLMPAAVGALAHQPRSVLVAEDALPLGDESMDAAVCLHALEAVRDTDGLLREIWRVLAPEGRLVVFVPRRTSLWAMAAATPFGYGRPWRLGEIRDQLARSCFAVDGGTLALRFPPLGAKAVPALAIERLGEALDLPFGGLLVVTARKRLAQPVTLGAPRLRPAQAYVWPQLATKAANGSSHSARGRRKESWPSSVWA